MFTLYQVLQSYFPTVLIGPKVLILTEKGEPCVALLFAACFFGPRWCACCCRPRGWFLPSPPPLAEWPQWPQWSQWSSWWMSAQRPTCCLPSTLGSSPVYVLRCSMAPPKTQTKNNKVNKFIEGKKVHNITICISTITNIIVLCTLRRTMRGHNHHSVPFLFYSYLLNFFFHFFFFKKKYTFTSFPP